MWHRLLMYKCLLQTNDESMQEYGARTLTQSVRSAGQKRIIARLGGAEALLRLLHKQHNNNLVLAALHALLNLSTNPDNQVTLGTRCWRGCRSGTHVCWSMCLQEAIGCSGHMPLLADMASHPSKTGYQVQDRAGRVVVLGYADVCVDACTGVCCTHCSQCWQACRDTNQLVQVRYCSCVVNLLVILLGRMVTPYSCCPQQGGVAGERSGLAWSCG